MFTLSDFILYQKTPVRQRFARIVHRLQVLFELAVALDCTVLRHIIPAVAYNHAADQPTRKIISV